MPRYFLEVAYKGARYSGFQVQQNANSVQAEVEKAFEAYFRQKVEMTGASRTDTGVHALQNYFHFDFPEEIKDPFLYNINAMLPRDIVTERLFPVAPTAHCRFNAESREYRYYVYKHKNPFLEDRAFYYPYVLEPELLSKAAALLDQFTDFTSFSKRNTQVRSFICNIRKSGWITEGDCLVYQVESNRFLRGMVRGLVGTMLRVGRGRISLGEFEQVIRNRDASAVDFSVPPHGLFLVKVNYPEGLLNKDAVGF
jgi:tRNA pseudouridine38-40 synthase